MQKSIIILIVSGALIGIALILLVLGNQIILEGINQGDGKVSSDQTLVISVDFVSKDTSGVFAVQIIEFKDNTFSAKVLDPFDSEIISQTINEETIEKGFDVLETGTYKLIIESTSNEETQMFAAIGPLPDTGKKSLGFVSVYILVIGMVGLVASGIYGIKNRVRSV
ncbi:MAG: hypothetical protein QQN44_03840 [Nitrosopumilus sp.]